LQDVLQAKNVCCEKVSISSLEISRQTLKNKAKTMQLDNIMRKDADSSETKKKIDYSSLYTAT
tara:strand:- start:372 stop:560 length:189 start_codon:yes stop_codon:yes gene_type:complete